MLNAWHNSSFDTAKWNKDGKVREKRKLQWEGFCNLRTVLASTSTGQKQHSFFRPVHLLLKTLNKIHTSYRMLADGLLIIFPQRFCHMCSLSIVLGQTLQHKILPQITRPPPPSPNTSAWDFPVLLSIYVSSPPPILFSIPSQF